MQGDVTQLVDLERVFQTTANKLGKIDALVVNAGGAIRTGTSATVETATEDDFQRAIELNLKSFLFTVQKALPHLRDGASVVLVASNAVHRALAGLTIYSAAKAGVISFAHSFSQTLLPRRIRVNVLSPGRVDTPAFDKFGLSAAVVEVKAGFANTIPLRRTGEPREMGRVAAFLVADDSSFLLGTEVLADSGSINL